MVDLFDLMCMLDTQKEPPMADVWVYAPVLGAVGSTVDISASEAKHAFGARRLRAGDSVTFFDGVGSTAIAEILDGRSRHGERCARVISIAFTPRPSLPLTLAFAVPKGDRLATLLDMGTQAGVDRFLPMDCVRSVVEEEKLSRTERWQRILLEACKQSRRAWAPELVAGGPLDEIALREQLRGAVSLLAHVERNARSMGDALAAARARASDAGITVWIGPEGGLTLDEVGILHALGAEVASLGPHILRIETAVLATACIYADLRG